MNSDAILIVLTIFVGITAISFVGQAIALLRIAGTAKEMKQRVDDFLPKAEKLLKQAETTLTDSKAQILQITTHANEILELTKTQVQRVNELVTDASTRARHQMDRAEVALDDTITRVNSTVNSVQGTIMRPVREISGVAAGVKAAVGHLMKGAPTNVTQATADEEMFI
jgi:F0F1-type ATP synthase membrane subunit b/b'